MYVILTNLKKQIYKFPQSLSANPKKWSNTLKTIRRQQPTNFLRVFDQFVGLVLKGLNLLIHTNDTR